MKSKNKQPKIFVICGPSGAGEDSIIDGLEKKVKFNRVITTVTRKKRPGEKQGHPYYFISVTKFKALLKKDSFVEWAIVYDDYRGCTKKEIDRLLKLGQPIIWKVDWHGAKTIKKILPKSIIIFITVPSYKTLEQRLLKRGQDSLQKIKKRKQFTQQWLKQKKFYDYKVINYDGKLKESIKKVLAIIKKY
jgi:guanylate kinase